MHRNQATKPYSILALPNDAILPREIAATLDLMAAINAQRNSNRDLLSRLVNVQTNSENYVLGASTMADVTAAISTLNSNMNKLNDALRVCGRTPASCAAPSLASVATVTVPAIKPLPTHALLRSYARPSYFLVDGGNVKNCTGPFVRIGGVWTRPEADLSMFDVVPGLNGAPGTVSLQNAQMKLPMGVNLGSTCYGWNRFVAATTTSGKDGATFYRLKGLNGRPNTWSFRLYGAGESYLSLTKNVPIRLLTPPDPSDSAATEAFKDNASWYVDAQ